MSFFNNFTNLTTTELSASFRGIYMTGLALMVGSGYFLWNLCRFLAAPLTISLFLLGEYRRERKVVKAQEKMQ